MTTAEPQAAVCIYSPFDIIDSHFRFSDIINSCGEAFSVICVFCGAKIKNFVFFRVLPWFPLTS